MPKRALSEHRPYLLASLAAAVSYYFVQDDPIGGIWLMAWKGAGVGFLALYAAHRGKGADAALIALVLAFGALGDIFIQISLVAGGALFGLGHLVAVWLYLRNRRERTTGSQKLAGLALFVLTPAIAALIAYPQDDWQIAAIYAVLLGAMAATAWTSRFPRYRVGTGAVLFVVSDWIIFAREAGSIPDAVGSWLIWPMYYVGQFLIATGVVQTLRHPKRRADI
ncbi:lysoplasmalogenase [Qipengyuania gaetbuli]|uniref:lysoplasmalogenase n=1 Tax=Qipengyuania gaetbuli TaxID=266952 RepID=UPI001C99F8C1|nr:lysoplasmalogenase [Qipengyuania gaetbuli]MBY6013744.1 lysoplasmalogenase [Qipengyuania gaetbuli]